MHPPEDQPTDGSKKHEDFGEGASSWILGNLQQLSYPLLLLQAVASEHTSLSQLVLATLGLEVGVRSPVQVVGWRYSPAVVPWLHPPNLLALLLSLRGVLVGSDDGGEVPVAGGSTGVKLLSVDDPRAGMESTTTQLLLNQLPGNQ